LREDRVFSLGSSEEEEIDFFKCQFLKNRYATCKWVKPQVGKVYFPLYIYIYIYIERERERGAKNLKKKKNNWRLGCIRDLRNRYYDHFDNE
jgi:hypothetical protein